MGRFWALCMCRIISGTLNSESGYNWQCQVAGWWIAWLVSWLGSLHRWHINSGQLPPTNTQPALYLHSSLHPALVLRHPLSSAAQALPSLSLLFISLFYPSIGMCDQLCSHTCKWPVYISISACLSLSLVIMVGERQNRDFRTCVFTLCGQVCSPWPDWGFYTDREGIRTVIHSH